MIISFRDNGGSENCLPRTATRTLKKGSGTLNRNGTIPRVKVVHHTEKGEMLILSADRRALPEREQRNFVSRQYFSTRFPGGHVENCPLPKQF
jgi:hypothetical protein